MSKRHWINDNNDTNNNSNDRPQIILLLLSGFSSPIHFVSVTRGRSIPGYILNIMYDSEKLNQNPHRLLRKTMNLLYQTITYFTPNCSHGIYCRICPHPTVCTFLTAYFIRWTLQRGRGTILTLNTWSFIRGYRRPLHSIKGLDPVGFVDWQVLIAHLVPKILTPIIPLWNC